MKIGDNSQYSIVKSVDRGNQTKQGRMDLELHFPTAIFGHPLSLSLRKNRWEDSLLLH